MVISLSLHLYFTFLGKKSLMKDAHNFLSFTELKERFDVKTKFLVYHGLVSYIKLLRNAIQNQNETNKF